MVALTGIEPANPPFLTLLELVGDGSRLQLGAAVQQSFEMAASATFSEPSMARAPVRHLFALGVRGPSMGSI